MDTHTHSLTHRNNFCYCIVSSSVTIGHGHNVAKFWLTIYPVFGPTLPGFVVTLLPFHLAKQLQVSLFDLQYLSKQPEKICFHLVSHSFLWCMLQLASPFCDLAVLHLTLAPTDLLCFMAVSVFYQ